MIFRVATNLLFSYVERSVFLGYSLLVLFPVIGLVLPAAWFTKAARTGVIRSAFRPAIYAVAFGHGLRK